MTDQNTQLLVTIDTKLGELLSLFTLAGLSAGVLRRTLTPMWTEDDCDGECDITGTPCPTDKLHSIRMSRGGHFSVHPGVSDYTATLDKQPKDAEELCEIEVPPTFLRPTTVASIVAGDGANSSSKARRDANGELEWTRPELDTFNRPKLMAVAKQLGIRDILKPKGFDYRFESTEWLRAACIAKSDGKKLPKFESEKNMGVEAAAKKPAKKKATKKKAPAKK